MRGEGKPVDMICVCSADGEIRPLRFRLENEEHQLLRVDIEEVISSRKIPYVGAEAQVFKCRGIADGIRWQFELKYLISIHSWVLTGGLH